MVGSLEISHAGQIRSEIESVYALNSSCEQKHSAGPSSLHAVLVLGHGHDRASTGQQLQSLPPAFFALFSTAAVVQLRSADSAGTAEDALQTCCRVVAHRMRRRRCEKKREDAPAEGEHFYSRARERSASSIPVALHLLPAAPCPTREQQPRHPIEGFAGTAGPPLVQSAGGQTGPRHQMAFASPWGLGFCYSCTPLHRITHWLDL